MQAVAPESLSVLLVYTILQTVLCCSSYIVVTVTKSDAPTVYTSLATCSCARCCVSVGLLRKPISDYYYSDYYEQHYASAV
jgi:hypothetical protein